MPSIQTVERTRVHGWCGQKPDRSRIFAFLPATRQSAAYSLTYAYDAAGNLSSASDGRSYAYDPAGKMVRDQKAGVASAHLYNWEGRRTTSGCEL